jgi:uncharacterized membrane protein
MNQKHIGIMLLIVSVLIALFVAVSQLNESSYVKEYVMNEGTCFLEDGTCLHKQNLPLYIFGWVLSASILIFGIYLVFFDKTQKFMTEHQIKVSEALSSAKKHEREKDEFKAYLAGFEKDEQKVLSAIKEQEGIKQSTLRYRTNISKTALSLILKALEDKKVITRKPSGKTKEIYLVKKF